MKSIFKRIFQSDNSKEELITENEELKLRITELEKCITSLRLTNKRLRSLLKTKKDA